MKNLLVEKFPHTTDEKWYAANKNVWVWATSLCMVVFILCIVTCVAPLQRMADVSLLANMPISKLLVMVGAWLSSDLSLTQNVQNSRVITGNGEFLLLIAFSFVIYCLWAWIIRYKMPPEADYTSILAIIAVGMFATGLIFIFTPALLSRDILTYADYGRTILVYHSNPYFVPPILSSFHDPITRLDSWKDVVNTYGPLWLYICSFFSFFLGTDPVRYIFAFRVLGWFSHILNILLIMAILHAMGQSRRTIVLGVLLYGCNPLVLLESCLDAHNDTCMITFILLGMWLSLRAERKNFIQLRGYVPPLLALTMAILIKFTSTPLILLFIFLLMRKTLLETHPQAVSRMLRWGSALLNACIAGVICGFTVLLFYAPFWIGHSISAIVRSFSLAPSSYAAANSIMRVFVEWVRFHGFPPRTSWRYECVYLLSQRSTWNSINTIVLLMTLLMGAVLLWRVPTVRSMVLAALIVFEGVLLVTPWFYAWYVLWIVALAAILLAEHTDCRNNRYVLFAFVFSASAFFTYLMPYYLRYFDSWLGARYVLTNASPVLVLLGCIAACLVRRKTVSRTV